MPAGECVTKLMQQDNQKQSKIFGDVPGYGRVIAVATADLKDRHDEPQRVQINCNPSNAKKPERS